MVEKIKDFFKSCFSNGPKRIIIGSVVVALTVIVVIANRKTFIVSVDGKEQKVVTYRSTYKAALVSNNIEVGSKDKTTPSLDSRVVSGGKIAIKRAVNVKVEVDGKVLDLKSAENSAEKLLEAEGIGLQDFDKVLPSKDVALKDGLKIAVVRVQTKDIKENKSIDFSTVVQKSEDMQSGEKKVVQEGQSGEKEVLTRVMYENGKEVSRKVVSETVKKNPVEKIVAVGTVNTYSPSRGSSFAYSRALQMKSTAYNAYGYKGGGSYTATGTQVKRNKSGYSTVAVDPRVIPLGTKLYVEGYGYAIAEDTGGAIKGNIIDLYFNSEAEANNWGVKTVNVYIMK